MDSYDGPVYLITNHGKVPYDGDDLDENDLAESWDRMSYFRDQILKYGLCHDRLAYMPEEAIYRPDDICPSCGAWTDHGASRSKNTPEGR